MAKINDSFLLCRNNAAEDFVVGIAQHSSPNRIIVTYAKKGIYVYDYEEKSAYKSWSVEQRYHATNYAIQVESTNDYYCVFNEKDIFQWSDHCPTFGEFSHISVEKPVYRLHAPTTTPIVTLNQPIIISTDGTVALMSSSNSNGTMPTTRKRAKRTKPNDIQVVWSSIWSQKNNFLYVGIITCRDDEYYLNVKELQDQNQSFVDVLMAKLSIDKQTDLLAMDYNFSRNILVSQWSDKSLRQSPNITNLLQSKTSLSEEDSRINLQVVQYNSLSDVKKSQSKVSLALLNSQYVVSAEKSVDGDNTEAILSLWDLTFGTLQCRHNLLESLKLDEDIAQSSDNTLQIVNISPYLFIAIDTAVIVCYYECQPASLLSVLGMKMPSTSDSNSVCTNTINISDWKGHEKDQNLLQAWNKAASYLSNESNYTAVKKFEKAVDEVLSALSPVKGYAKAMYCNALSQLLHQCIVMEKIWPRNAFIKLIRANGISFSACPSLFPTIFEKDDMVLFLLAVKKIRNLSEAVIVRGMKYILLASESVITEADKELKKNDDSELNETLIEFNDIQITKRKAEYLYPALVRYLIYLLKLCIDDKNHRMKAIKQTLVLDWINALLDSHYIQFTLSKDAHQVIKELFQLVQTQIHIYDKIHRLRGFLEYFRGSFSLSKPKQIQNYSIEVISL
ncbi:uncharacterized protein TRIADDRAFT_53635 [Trichoplax adhaerens]|uniref:Nucleolar protein 11 n=1 Tax=Trichoplax adhaerens TaxID=10228 RepID=B3RPR4_TRIAD|nr:hypothetical protein TRIADDRAFT_53635 [Trichoplax adhaerens]EDV27686.1 hypothetical protein TRIADDRAFT_53635 [Trichoplax adhaerens]|eukprot:XP_002109520.1 hypothetical protein TRIADDRAFT_53635 [Trichoplax adhaerens]